MFQWSQRGFKREHQQEISEVPEGLRSEGHLRGYQFRLRRLQRVLEAFQEISKGFQMGLGALQGAQGVSEKFQRISLAF